MVMMAAVAKVATSAISQASPFTFAIVAATISAIAEAMAAALSIATEAAFRTIH